MTTDQPKLSTYLAVYVLLLVGLGATVAAAFVPLGNFNGIVAETIALAKAAAVVLIFMHVLYSPRLTWLAVAAGLVWLAIMIALMAADYSTRNWIPQPEVHAAPGSARG